MQALARVLFHVQASDADALCDRRAARVERRNLDPAVLGDGLVELRDLVALGRVGIEVVLAREDAGLANLAVDRLRRQHRKLHRLAVQHRQRAWQAEAGRADVRVRLAAVLVHAAAEGLGLRKELDVNLKPDHGLVLGKNLGRKRGCGGHDSG